MAQADLFELEWEGKPALLKDFSRQPWLMRRIWARPVAAHEVKVLAQLNGLGGVPRLYAKVGPEAFIMERLDATRLPHKREPAPPAHFWTDARQLLEAFHARGIGHGDLRRKNLLIGPRGQAYMIDFATAFCRKERGWNAGLINALVRRYQQIDRVTYARIKASYDTAALDADERQWLEDQPWYLRLGRFFKKRVYRLRKASFWRDQAHKVGRWVRHKFHPPSAE